jgi:hypothetical protein
MTASESELVVHEQQHADKTEQVTGTSTPAEEREEQRARDSLWNLKEDAKWGKDVETQKKAIRDLTGIGTPALTHLEEILSVVPPGEIKQYCQNAINSLIHQR